jgi:hypothetical protein
MNLDVTKLFRDCCIFDLKQALTDNFKDDQIKTLDNDCFSSLTNSIGTITTTEIEQEQFHQWVRLQFPTLFYGFEMWLRKNAILNNSNNASPEASASVCYFLSQQSFYTLISYSESFNYANG